MAKNDLNDQPGSERKFRDVFARLWRAPVHIYERVLILFRVDKAFSEAVRRKEAEREKANATPPNVRYVNFGGAPPPQSSEPPRRAFLARWLWVGVSVAAAVSAISVLQMNTPAAGSTIQTAPSQTRTQELPDDSVMDVAGGSLAKARFSKQRGAK